MRSNINYDALQREFITGKMSIRELCRRHDIKGYSAVADRARRDGWYAERQSFKAKTSEKTIERLSDQAADIAETMRSEMVTVVRAALYKFAEDLKRDDYVVSPKDVVALIQQGLLLIGEPTSRTEEKTLAISGELPAESVRELLGAIRLARSQSSPTGGAVLPPVVTGRQN